MPTSVAWGELSSRLVPFWALDCQRREFDATSSYGDAVFFLLELSGSILIPRLVTAGLPPPIVSLFNQKVGIDVPLICGN